eukprot:TRINITY_DN67640_c0_g1_i1.p1 TRINITY_DN67640_c0_g1~~TRINITY_DN67640_c0_g1_i1.p1  ORF type:complete len:1462 (+),score=156.61 TRINITY_DN67640_c0_g1_i1:104-4489(+)
MAHHRFRESCLQPLVASVEGSCESVTDDGMETPLRRLTSYMETRAAEPLLSDSLTPFGTKKIRCVGFRVFPPKCDGRFGDESKWTPVILKPVFVDRSDAYKDFSIKWPLAADDWQTRDKEWKWKIGDDLFTGRMAMILPIDQKTQMQWRGVPKEAVFCSYSYAVKDSVTTADDGLKSFLANGGFLYFDDTMRLIRINALMRLLVHGWDTPVQDDGSFHLSFGNPITIPQPVFMDLKESDGFHSVTRDSCFYQSVRPFDLDGDPVGLQYSWVPENQFVSVEDTPLGFPYGMFIIRCPEGFDETDAELDLSEDETAKVRDAYMHMPDRPSGEAVREAASNLERGLLQKVDEVMMKRSRKFEKIHWLQLLSSMGFKFLAASLTFPKEVYAVIFHVAPTARQNSDSDSDSRQFPMYHDPLIYLRADSLIGKLRVHFGWSSAAKDRTTRRWTLTVDKLPERVKCGPVIGGEKTVHGKIAPVFQCTLVDEDREKLRIPEHTVFFCWSHPVKKAREARYDETFTNEEIFLSNGGYIYFDKDFKITAIFGVRVGTEGSVLPGDNAKDIHAYHFGPPMPMSARNAMLLMKRGRFQTVFEPALQKRGAVMFSWLWASEKIGHEAIPSGFPDGAFCYLVDAKLCTYSTCAQTDTEIAKRWFNEHCICLADALARHRWTRKRYEDIMISRLRRSGGKLLRALKDTANDETEPQHDRRSFRLPFANRCVATEGHVPMKDLISETVVLMDNFRVSMLSSLDTSGLESVYFGLLWYRFPIALFMSMCMVVSIFAGLLIDSFIVVFQQRSNGNVIIELVGADIDFWSRLMFIGLPFLTLLSALLVDELSDLVGDSFDEPYFLRLRTTFLACQPLRDFNPLPTWVGVFLVDAFMVVVLDVLPWVVMLWQTHHTNPNVSYLQHVRSDTLGAFSMVAGWYLVGLVFSSTILAVASILSMIRFQIMAIDVYYICHLVFMKVFGGRKTKNAYLRFSAGYGKRLIKKLSRAGTSAHMNIDHQWRSDKIHKTLENHRVRPFSMTNNYEALRRAFHNEQAPKMPPYQGMFDRHYFSSTVFIVLASWICWFVISVAIVMNITQVKAHPLASFGFAVIFLSMTIFFTAKLVRKSCPSLVGLPFTLVLVFFMVAVLVEAVVSLQSINSSDIGGRTLLPIMNLTGQKPEQWKNGVNYRYPVCSKRFGSSGVDLTVLDLAAFAWATYEEDPKTAGKMVEQSLAPRNVEILHVGDSTALPRTLMARLKSVHQHEPDTVVIAVKGTSTFMDVSLDLSMFACIKLLQIFDLLVNIFGLSPPDLVRSVLSSARLPQTKKIFTKITDVLKKQVLDAQSMYNATVVLTGHSLGGAFAQIVAAQTGVNALVWSAPGSYYSQAMFNMTTEATQRTVTVIAPDSDQVAMVDRQAGAVQPIQCRKKDGQAGLPTLCHLLTKSACEIWRVCTDAPWNRNFSIACHEYVDESKLGELYNEMS